MSEIAFLGFGNMGAPMASNLIKGGHRLIGYDPSPDAMKKCVAMGGRPARTIAEAVSQAEVVVTVLPTPTVVEAAYAGNEGILEAARSGALLVDCSTVHIDQSRKLIKAANDRGFAMVEAPISGGVEGSKAGTLTFMVGGDEAAFRRAAVILEAMGKRIFYAGAGGSGQAAKLCNNLISMIGMVSVCEAFVLAERLGLDARRFYDIACASTANSWALTARCPVAGIAPDAPANRNFDGGGAAKLALETFEVIQTAAQSVHAPVPLVATATTLTQLMVNAGLGEKDFSAMFRFLQHQY